MLRNPAFLAALAITIIWLVAIVYWLNGTPLTDPQSCTIWRPLCPIRELDLNEAGDFFAGAFSVLAFLWLATAVILQGVELNRQLHEFEATRLAAEKQAAVMLASLKIQEDAEKTNEILASIFDLTRYVVEKWPTSFVLKNLGNDEVKTILFGGELTELDVGQVNHHERFAGMVETLAQDVYSLDGCDVSIEPSEDTGDYVSVLSVTLSKTRDILATQEVAPSSLQNSRLFPALSNMTSLCLRLITLLKTTTTI